MHCFINFMGRDGFARAFAKTSIPGRSVTDLRSVEMRLD